jgi:phage terminase large subunit
LKKTSMIIADSAEPKSIEELSRLGWRNIQGAYKGPDSIRNGVNKLLSFEVFCDPSSTHLVDEYNLYSWDKTGDRPEDENNHLMDAIRYGLSKIENNGTYGFYSKGTKKPNPDEDFIPLAPIDESKFKIYTYK